MWVSVERLKNMGLKKSFLLLKTLFMNFAIFNVADICVVCGGIAFCAYYLLCHGKEEDGHDAAAPEG